jgi:hypothetical protein
MTAFRRSFLHAAHANRHAFIAYAVSGVLFNERGSSSLDNQEGGFLITDEVMNLFRRSAQECFNFRCTAIPKPNPNHLFRVVLLRMPVGENRNPSTQWHIRVEGRSPTQLRRVRTANRHPEHGWFREKQTTALKRAWAKDCGRAAASRCRPGRGQFALPVSRELQACPNICPGQIGEIREDLVLSHVGSQVLKHVINRDTQTPNARFAAPLARFNGDN